LPVHQVYQGNCGGPTVPEVLAWYGIEQGVDNLEYATSPDKASWDEWHAPATVGGGA
jgi:phenol hydroxylase P3 protein